MSAPVIQVENLSKLYRIGVAQELHDTLRDQITHGFKSLLRRANQSRRDEDFWALQKVSFEINEGEVVGIIGRNGAGKSTLLKILSRITTPTEGKARIFGRVGSLLEVGTGFHPELTGRENVYLNGAILGMKNSEIKSKFDEIIAFSEIEKFIDTPVKRYSSGMYVRLAFAVAAHLEPEVLIIDEVLAVGDMAFQRKCLGKMGEVAGQGRTVLFVSHNMAAIEHLCSRVLMLESGMVKLTGDPKEVIDRYVAGFSTNGNHDSQSHVIDLMGALGRSKKYRPLLMSLELFTDSDQPLNGGIKVGSRFKARVHLQLKQPTADFDVMLGFDNHLGQRIFTASTEFQPGRPAVEYCGDQTVVCDIPSLTLVPGEYKIKVALSHRQSTIDSVEDAARLRILESDYYGTGKTPWAGLFVLKHHWHLQDDHQ